MVAGGAAKCWGHNQLGQLGDGGTTRQLTPVTVSGLSSGVADIGAGVGHSCALTTDGGVKCWGDGYFGQLGNGDRNQSLTPVNVSGFSSGTQTLAVGANHNCLAKADGQLYCWGTNQRGEGGNGLADPVFAVPELVPSVTGVTAIAAGNSFTCVLVGGARCFGNNNDGELGNGVQLIFGVVDVFGIFIATVPSIINYSVVTPVNTNSTIDLAKDYGAFGLLSNYTQPLHGVAGCSSFGVYMYTPTADYAGPDSFSYVLSFGGDPGFAATFSKDSISAGGVSVTGTVTLLVATKFLFVPLAQR